jgi:hypothetical protein
MAKVSSNDNSVQHGLAVTFYYSDANVQMCRIVRLASNPYSPDVEIGVLAHVGGTTWMLIDETDTVFLADHLQAWLVEEWEAHLARLVIA